MGTLNFMGRLGFSVPPHRPAIVGWVENLSFAYFAYVVIVAAPVYWTQLHSPDVSLRLFFISIVPSLASLIVLFGAIILTTRRGNKIAYWISITLLMSPTISVVRHFSDLSSGISPAQIFMLLFSSSAVVLLLLPSTRAWIRLRGSELKPKTTGDKKRELYRENIGSAVRLTGFVIGEECLRFVDVPSVHSTEKQFLIIRLEDTIPLITALRKAGRINRPPDMDLNTELLNLIESRFKGDRTVLHTAQQFMIDHGISCQLIQSGEE